MIGTSEEFKQAVQMSHEAISQVNIIRDGKVVLELIPYEGEVTADRTAAQMRQCTLQIADPTGELTPADASSLLTPFGTQFQVLKGVRLPRVDLVVDWAHDAASWTNGGDNNGTIADPSTGDLVLGYGS